jgi:hypothetical protein
LKKLQEIATPLLKKHKGNIEKALPEFVRAVKADNLIDDLARTFLRTVTVESGSGYQVHEAQSSIAGPATPIIIKKGGSIKVSAHDVRQHRRRTHAEREAAERAMMASAEAVFELQINGRAIGNIAIGEMASLKHDQVKDATFNLIRGEGEVRNAVLAELIENHCTAQDQLARVRDVVSAATLAQFVAQAEREAPRRIAYMMLRAAEAAAHHEEIAQ